MMIEFENVWKVFGPRESDIGAKIRSRDWDESEAKKAGCVVAVSDVSLSIRKGETFCIMGLSGSGKSTLLRHVNRLVEPTSGIIRVLGRNVGELSSEELRRLRSDQIGMVFQNFSLLPHRSVLNNVALPLEVRRLSRFERQSRAEKALDLVELSGWEDHMVDQLSGGMQQRVGIARALAADPPILLMDEPFSALDPLIRRQLQGLFKTLIARLQKTTLFITHDLDEAIRMGDRIAIMRDGRVVQVGTPEEIVLHPADSYVADFVADVSTARVLKVGSIAIPLSDALHKHDEIDRLPKIGEDTDVQAAITLAARYNSDLLVVDTLGAPTGVVTRLSLLQALASPEK